MATKRTTPTTFKPRDVVVVCCTKMGDDHGINVVRSLRELQPYLQKDPLVRDVGSFKPAKVMKALKRAVRKPKR